MLPAGRANVKQAGRGEDSEPASGEGRRQRAHDS